MQQQMTTCQLAAFSRQLPPQLRKKVVADLSATAVAPPVLTDIVARSPRHLARTVKYLNKGA